MKKLIQIGLSLLFISSATAQESPSQQLSNILRVYDWKDLARQQTLPGEVISTNGNSFLKIENTNDSLLEFSLFKIADSSVIQKAYFLFCEVKYDVPNGGRLELLCRLPPAAPGGGERTSALRHDGYSDSGYIFGNSNWRPCRLEVDRNAFEGLPTQLEVRLSLQRHGTIYLSPIRLLGVTGSWWSPQQSGLIGGIGGSVIGCFGALLGVLASKGKARTFVLTTTKIFIVLGILLTIAGFVAVVSGQPYAVWYALLLPGVILTLVFSLTLPSIQRRYDELEIRRMTSIDATGS